MNRKLVFAVLSIVCLAGMLVSVTLSIGVSDQPAYMVVRGSDNGIYYRLFNEASGTWGAWTNLPGSTCDSPSAAYIGDQLCVVVRGMDGSSMWQGFVNVNTGAFSGWTYLSGSTPSAVELGSASTPSTGFESTGYITIPGSAFAHRYTTQNTEITYYLRNRDTVSATFYAPILLPHGVTVTNVTSYWYDVDTSEDVYCQISRVTSFGTANIMSIVSSSGSAGYGSTTDTTIGYSSIDNTQYGYSVYVIIPANFPGLDLELCHVTIGFAYPT